MKLRFDPYKYVKSLTIASTFFLIAYLVNEIDKKDEYISKIWNNLPSVESKITDYQIFQEFYNSVVNNSNIALSYDEDSEIYTGKRTIKGIEFDSIYIDKPPLKTSDGDILQVRASRGNLEHILSMEVITDLNGDLKIWTTRKIIKKTNNSGYKYNI